jgi:hypothetical protein
MNEQKLIRTFDEFEYDVISEVVSPEHLSEDAHGNTIKIPAVKKLTMKGIIQKSDSLNQNGRIYPRHILDREVRNYQKFIQERRSLGECDHPDSSVINLKNASHIITEAYMDDKGVVYGTLEVLNTPSGQIVQSLVESKVKIGISSRGVGSTKKQGDYQVVQDDYMIICWDIVSEPSTSGAFMIPEGRTVTSQELSRLFNRSDRIDRVLNDILSSRGSAK